MTLFFSRSTVSGIMTHSARLNLSVLKLRIYVLTLLASRYSDKVSYNEVCKHCFVFSIPKLCYMPKNTADNPLWCLHWLSWNHQSNWAGELWWWESNLESNVCNCAVFDVQGIVYIHPTGRFGSIAIDVV